MRLMRQDAWTKDEDIILAETTLRYIREGKTQLDAFKEVANKLSRTPAACGFRWNSTIRKQYVEAIELARSERKNGLNTKESLDLSKDFIDEVKQAIALLSNLNLYQLSSYESYDRKNALITELREENMRLKKKIQRYEDAWTEMGRLWNWVEQTKES